MAGLKCSVLVVDDHVLVCEAIAALVEKSDTIHKVFTAFSATQATAIVQANRIQVALIDARMPKTSGIELATQLLTEYPALKIVGMTSFDEDDTVAEMLHAGVHGVLLKRSTNGQEINQCLHEVLAGKNYFAAEVKEKLTQNWYNLSKQALRFTRRERELLTLMCGGQSTKQIAETLSLQPSTIEDYRKALLKKTATKNTAELVALVLRNGLL